MTSQRAQAVLITILLGTITACASSPSPLYFALSARSGQHCVAVARTIEVRQPGLAGYLDHSEIVIGRSGHELRVGETKRWGEPLAPMISRVIAENLAERLPQSTVYAEGSGISQQPDAIIETAIERFEPDAQGVVVLRALVSLVDPKGEHAASTRTLVLRASHAAYTADDIVSTMSALLGQLSDDTVRRLADSTWTRSCMRLMQRARAFLQTHRARHSPASVLAL